MNTTDTNPRSLHDAMRRIQVLTGAAKIDLYAFIDNPAEYDAKEYMESVLELLMVVENIAVWMRETYTSGVRREGDQA